MRMILFVGAVLSAGLAASSASAAAAPTYPWCSGHSTGGGECAFNTREQCMESLSGIGGSCTQNPSYSGQSASQAIGLVGGPYNFSPARRHPSAR